MGIILWDLAGAEEQRRFSPYCWRIRMALWHKGLDFETIPWCFTEKDREAVTTTSKMKVRKVPVLVDGETIISDSWKIAEYLEDTYSDRPSLFGGPVGKAMARFITDWANGEIGSALFKLVVRDVLDHVAEKDGAYFRQNREAMVKMTLEEYTADPEMALARLRERLSPLRRTLRDQPYLAGNAPAWADYATFGWFQWARAISPKKLLPEDDAVFAWRERMLDSFGGKPRTVPGYPV